jgi:hypothetical protein
MGLFDTIVCHYSLPVKEHDLITSWQTKDLVCEMRSYVITAEGRLFLHGGGGEDTNYHGMLRFYSLFPESFDWSVDFDPTAKQEWVEYEAKFTDGTIVDIKKFDGVDWEKIWNSID